MSTVMLPSVAVIAMGVTSARRRSSNPGRCIVSMITHEAHGIAFELILGQVSAGTASIELYTCAKNMGITATAWP